MNMHKCCGGVIIGDETVHVSDSYCLTPIAVNIGINYIAVSIHTDVCNLHVGRNCELCLANEATKLKGLIH